MIGTRYGQRQDRANSATDTTCPRWSPASVAGSTLRIGLVLVALILPASDAANGAPGEPPPGFTAPFPPPPSDALHPGPHADAIEALRAEALAAGLSEVQARILSDRIARLAMGRLPWRPVLDRTHQGLAKGATFERIESVCASLEARLRSGAALVDDAVAALDLPRPGAMESPFDKPRPAADAGRLALIDHTTFALEKGVESAALTTMFQTLGADLPGGAAVPAEPLMALTAPVVALTTLSAEGIPAPRGVEVVTAAWKNGMRGGQMEELGFGLALALRSGRPPEDVMKQVIDLCRRGVAPEKILGDFPRPALRGRGAPGPGGPPAWLPGRPGKTERPGMRPGERPPDDPGKRGRPGRRGGSGSLR